MAMQNVMILMAAILAPVLVDMREMATTVQV